MVNHSIIDFVRDLFSDSAIQESNTECKYHRHRNVKANGKDRVLPSIPATKFICTLSRIN